MSTVDLHMHSCFSDGTDEPDRLVENLKKAGISTFSLTDHDLIDGCLSFDPRQLQGLRFIRGVEFSCICNAGKCHILGYGFDPGNPELRQVLAMAKQKRLNKFYKRIDYLKQVHDITLPAPVYEQLLAIPSTGKPHLADALVRLGYAKDRNEAMENYLNGCKTEDSRIDASIVIKAVLASGGVPGWAHPLGGEGERHLSEAEFARQLSELVSYGLQGLECWYSRYDQNEVDLLLRYAEKNRLWVSGGSDYHGKRKNIALGELNSFGRPVDADMLSILRHI